MCVRVHDVVDCWVCVLLLLLLFVFWMWADGREGRKEKEGCVVDGGGDRNFQKTKTTGVGAAWRWCCSVTNSIDAQKA